MMKSQERKKRFINLLSTMEQLQDSYDQMQFEGYLPYTIFDQSAWPVGETRMIGEIKSTKLSEGETEIIFDVEIPPVSSPDKGVFFKPHYHDCTEIITIKEGEMSDLVNNHGQSWKKGETILMKKNMVHAPGNIRPKKLKMNVRFLKKRKHTF